VRGVLRCSEACDRVLTDQCQKATQDICGDGLLQRDEECDTANFGSKTCRDFGFDRGDLHCTAECKIEKSGCIKDQPTDCGNGSCEATKGENCTTCPKDCGCASGSICQSGSCQASSSCGNGSCEAAKSENCSTCPQDCGCPNGQSCTNSRCQNTCTPNATKVCVGNTVYWQDSCGTRGGRVEDCPSGWSCTNGQCQDGCKQTRCGSSCVDTQSSKEHCGTCGNACSFDESCEWGRCK
jgi:hypothetical protein